MVDTMNTVPTQVASCKKSKGISLDSQLTLIVSCLHASILNVLCFFHSISLQWESSHRVHLSPYPLYQAVCLILIYQSVLEGEEGAVVAMTMYPSADNINLVYLGLPDDAWRVS
jgi:hypothetical protein